MQIRRNEEALVLTPDTEQDRALLKALAAAHTPSNWTPTPLPNSAKTTRHAASLREE